MRSRHDEKVSLSENGPGFAFGTRMAMVLDSPTPPMMKSRRLYLCLLVLSTLLCERAPQA